MLYNFSLISNIVDLHFTITLSEFYCFLATWPLDQYGTKYFDILAVLQNLSF